MNAREKPDVFDLPAEDDVDIDPSGPEGEPAAVGILDGLCEPGDPSERAIAAMCPDGPPADHDLFDVGIFRTWGAQNGQSVAWWQA